MVARVTRRLTGHGTASPPGGETSGDAALDDLVVAARAGDDDALTQLYRALHPGLVRYLRAKVGDEADDLAADTWVAVAQQLARTGPGVEAFRRLLFTIARRRAIDHHRKARRRRTDPAPLDELDALRFASDPGVVVDDALAGDEAVRLVARVLPQAQADVVLLRVVAGLSTGEVAAVVGRTPGSGERAAAPCPASAGERARPGGRRRRGGGTHVMRPMTCKIRRRRAMTTAMGRMGLDDGAVDALLDGTVDVDDLSPDYARVHQLLGAARPTGATHALPGEDATLARVRAVTGAMAAPSPHRVWWVRPRLPSRAAAIGVGLVLAASTAAAATGSLPGPLQQVAAAALSHVGVTVPDGGAAPATHRPTEVTPAAGDVRPNDPAGPPATTPAACTDPGAAPAVAGREGDPAATPACGATPPGQVTPATGPGNGNDASAHGNSDAGATHGNSGAPPSTVPARGNGQGASGKGANSGANSGGNSGASSSGGKSGATNGANSGAHNGASNGAKAAATG